MYKDIEIKHTKDFAHYSDAVLVGGDENAYRIVFKTPFDLSGCVFKVSCQRADGTVIADIGETDGNTAYYVLASSMYSVPGDMEMRLTLIDGEESIITFCSLGVRAVAGFGEATEEENLVPVLDSVLSSIAEIQGNVEEISDSFESHADAAVLDHPDGSVTSVKIASNAVTSGKIASGSVTSTKIADEAVTSAKIEPQSITWQKMAESSVGEMAIQSEAVTSGKIANGAVTLGKIAQGAVVGANIANEAISDVHISAGAVTTDKIRNGSVTLDKLSDRVKGQPGGYAPLDSSGKIPNEFLYGQTVKEYGVRWKGTSSTECERLGDAVGLVANAHLGSYDSTIRNDFDKIYPWSEIRICNIDAQGNILAFEGDPSFKRDGTNGDVMVRIPKFYYKRIKTSDGYEEWWICAVKLPGYELHPLFINDGNEVSDVFLAAYNLSTEGETTTIARSISGVQPTVRKTRANFRTYARAKGANWGIEDLSSLHARQMLYMIEYANTDSQTMLGGGVSSLQFDNTCTCVEPTTNTNEFYISTANANRFKVGQRIDIGTSLGNPNKTTTSRNIVSIAATTGDANVSIITFDGAPVAQITVGNLMWGAVPLNGSCDNLNGESGYIGTNNYADVSYRGIENFYSNLFGFIDGVNIKDNTVFYANSVNDYADGVFTGKYRPIGYTNGTANGYIKAFGYDETAPWVMFPLEIGGSSTTYIPDRYYQSAGECLLNFGGRFDYTSSSGVFCFACYNPLTVSDYVYGARLLLKKA